jgi:hypothetical protein
MSVMVRKLAICLGIAAIGLGAPMLSVSAEARGDAVPVRKHFIHARRHIHRGAIAHRFEDREYWGGHHRGTCILRL